MTVLDDSDRITVTNFQETSDVLTYIHRRVKKTEEITGTVDKVWKFLKWMTPIMIASLLAGVSHDSILYKVGSALLEILTKT